MISVSVGGGFAAVVGSVVALLHGSADDARYVFVASAVGGLIGLVPAAVVLLMGRWPGQEARSVIRVGPIQARESLAALEEIANTDPRFDNPETQRLRKQLRDAR